MAFKITKEEQAALYAAVDAANKAKSEFEAEVESVNAKLEELREQLNEKANAYNEAADAVTAQAEDLVNRLREEYDEKSERWQESERAEAVSSWIDDLEALAFNDQLNFELSDVSVDEPEWVEDSFNANFRSQPEE